MLIVSQERPHPAMCLLLALAASGCSAGSPGGGRATDAAPVADAAPGRDAGSDPEPAPPLRVLSYNIKHAELSSLEEIAAVINEIQPDVVALQEVDDEAERSGNVDQAYRLGQLTGMAASFRRAVVLADGGLYGLAILSRYPILSSEKVELTSTGEQRVAVLWELSLPDGTLLHVGNTHLGLDAGERATQAAELVELAAGASNALILGDLNEGPGGSVHDTLEGAGFRDAWLEAGQGDGFTFPASGPESRIDYAFVGADWGQVRAAEVAAKSASDHAALWIDLPMP